MNKKCQVFTPEDYVEKLLLIAQYGENPIGKKILENSCGDGNILCSIVRTYISYCKRANYTSEEIRDGLESDVYGIEIDPEQYLKCLNNLNVILNEESIPPVNWHLYNEDYLSWNEDILFSYIIGNPPYITYSELNENERLYVKANFESCKKGKFDYCYAFIEKSINLLDDNGELVYLVPSSIYKTVFGKKLREIMKPFLQRVEDYSNLQVFEKILVKSSIFQLRKNNISETLLYINNGTEKTLQKNILKDKWIFENEEEANARKFGDYFDVSHVVATLNNSVFVLNDYTEDDMYYYIDNYKIEKSCVKPTATPRSLRYGHEEKILFPYYYDNNSLCHYSEKKFSELFPETYTYLLSKKATLDLRKADKNALWFEYGRSQALSKINKEKLLISTVITDEVPVYRLSHECIPYAGMYITAKNELSLEDANLILRDNRFLEYTKRVGISITGSSVRITSKDIMEFRF